MSSATGCPFARDRRVRTLLALVLGAASLVWLGTISPAASAAGDLRIMPLGDSLTDGYSLPGGYRIALEDQILATGVGFDFVGGLVNGGSQIDDRDHEGHVGFTIGEIESGFVDWFDAHPADVVLLMAGTNDVKLDDTAIPDEAAAAANDLDGLLRTITGHAPNVDVIVSTIPPQAAFFGPTRAAAYNALIPGVVLGLKADGRKVSLVDGAAVLSTADLADGLHLDAQGYDALAGEWFDGLDGLLVPPSTTTTVPSTTTTVPGGGSLVGLDGFGRGDSSVLGVADVGGVWSSLGVGFGVAGGAAAVTSGGGEGVALLDVGVVDVGVEAAVMLSSVRATPGLSVRAVDEKNQLLVSLVRKGSQDRVSLYRVVGGSYGLLGEVTGAGLVLGQSYVLRLEAVGDVVRVFVDGGLLLEHVLSGADAVTFGSRTGVGLRTYRSGGGDDGGSRWDDVRIDSLDSSPTTTTTTTTVPSTTTTVPSTTTTVPSTTTTVPSTTTTVPSTTTTVPSTTTTVPSTTTTVPSTTTTVPGGGSLVGLDGFGRGDSSVLGVADVGGVWSSLGVGFGVAGGAAAVTSGGGEGVALLDVGVVDVGVEAAVMLSSVRATPGLSVRAVDEKNQLLVSLVRKGSQDRVSLYRVVGGSYGLLGEVTGAGLVLGQSYVLRLEAVGDVVRVFVDGGLLLEHVLSGADAVTFGSRTGVGLRTYRSGGGDDGGSRWDDVRIDSLDSSPTTTTTTTTVPSTTTTVPSTTTTVPSTTTTVPSTTTTVPSTTTTVPSTTTTVPSTTTTTVPSTTTTVPGGGSLVGLDGFGRGDSSVLGVADVGGVWSSLGVGFGVAGGAAAVTSGGGEGVALLDVGVVDVGVEAAVMLSSVRATPGLSVRAVDEKNQLLVSLVRKGSQDRVSLYRVVGGSYGLLGEVTGAGLVLGQSYVLRLEAVGDVVRVFVDGGLLLEHVLSGADAVTFGSRTGVGLRTYRSGGGDDGGSRWDDVRIDSLDS